MTRKRLKAATAILATVMLAGGVSTVPVEAQETYRVSGKLFLDSNGNGINDDGVERFEGTSDFTFALQDGQGRVLTQYLNIKANSRGEFIFYGLQPGRYRIWMTSPTASNWRITKPETVPENFDELQVSNIETVEYRTNVRFAYGTYFDITDSNVSQYVGVVKDSDVPSESSETSTSSAAPSTTAEEPIVEESTTAEPSPVESSSEEAVATSSAEASSAQDTEPVSSATATSEPASTTSASAPSEPSSTASVSAPAERYSISGSIFQDNNADGLDNDYGGSLSSRIGGIQLTLQTPSGEYVASTRSTATGFIFENVAPGEYRIRATARLDGSDAYSTTLVPASSIELPGVSDVAFFDEDQRYAYSYVFTVAGDVSNVDFGKYFVAQATPNPAMPPEETSEQESSTSEPSSPSTSVSSVSEQPSEVPSETPTEPSSVPSTSASSVPSSEPSSVPSTSASSAPSSEPSTPPTGPTYTVSGVVFNDRNGDGYNNDEKPEGALSSIGNFQLRLLDEQGEVVQNLRTDFNGYTFTDVAPGTYRVQVLQSVNIPFRFTWPAVAPSSLADQGVSDVVVDEEMVATGGRPASGYAYSPFFDVNQNVSSVDFGVCDPYDNPPPADDDPEYPCKLLSETQQPAPTSTEPSTSTEPTTTEPSTSPIADNQNDQASDSLWDFVKKALGFGGVAAVVLGLVGLGSGSSSGNALSQGAAPVTTKPGSNAEVASQSQQTPAQQQANASEAAKSAEKSAAKQPSKQASRSALASTGASVIGVIVLALALVGLGVLLVGRRRKDEGLGA